MLNYDYVINYDQLTINGIKYLNNLKYQNPNSRVLVNIKNTKGLSSRMLMMLDSSVSIRVAGAYDETKLQVPRYKEFETKVIYSRNELVKIIQEIEKLESGIKPEWSEVQILIYYYQKLKTSICYDPKYEQKDSYDIRTLRGLITKQTVCAGYALILKEVLNRQGITAEYVGGQAGENGGGHAWNIVEIDGKKYPIDLTWDAGAYTSGKNKALNYLGLNTKEFRLSHIPGKWEPVQDYELELSSLDPNLIKQIYRQMNIEQQYGLTTFVATRRDGTRFRLAQIGSARIEGRDYYRYLYVDLTPGATTLPVIVFSETNVAKFVQMKQFNNLDKIPPGYEYAIDNLLFSKQNLSNSLDNGILYIGGATIIEDGKRRVVSSVAEIEKPQEKCKLFDYPTKQYVRSDGTTFIAQLMTNPIKVCGVEVVKFDVFEVVNEDGKSVVKRNSVWTERNFFRDGRQEIADELLSRERLDYKTQECGGYIGYLDVNGLRRYNVDLVEFFDTSKKIDASNIVSRPLKFVPSFDQLRELARNYVIKYVTDPQNPMAQEMKVFDANGNEVTDEELLEKIEFANIWLSAAGVKWYYEEEKPGFNYAFNDQARRLYDYVVTALKFDVKKDGVINTVKLLKDIDAICYKYSEEIVVNLFRNKHQTEFINDYFKSLEVQTVQPLRQPEPLYSMMHAAGLVNLT